nr:ADP-ribose glycohydrolase ARH3-like isoform X1 [Rhipicephalus microplus]
MTSARDSSNALACTARTAIAWKLVPGVVVTAVPAPYLALLKSALVRARAIAAHMRMSTDTTLVEKFEGCLVGALVGDCMGAPFETDFTGSHFPNQQTFFQNLLKHTVVPGPSAGRNFRPSKVHPGRGEYHYTDDTAMTMCLAKSLLTKRRFDAFDVAKRFTTEYFENEALVGEYGNAVRDVFRKLKNNNYEDPYRPGQEQFGGRGSYGNGAAMRVAPVALFFMDDLEKMVEVARNQAKITHSNKIGYNAAIMQCMAVYLALNSDPKTPLDSMVYLDHLIALTDKLEEAVDGFKPLVFKLMHIKKILSNPELDPSPAEVAKMLGNDITAQGSVPTAIYSFLRSQRPLKEFEHESSFVRCLYFAVACGGDADTIASMACSISGAFHGISAIPSVLQRQCQAVDEVTRIADCLEEAVSK